MIEIDKRALLINGILFKATWVGCVLGGNLWGGVALAILFAHALFTKQLGRHKAFIFSLPFIGLFLDSFWMAVGVLDYGSTSVEFGSVQLAPLWIVMLWLGVAVSIYQWMAMFVRRPWFGGILVGASAPFSYLAGANFAAVTIPDKVMLIPLGISWWLLYFAIFAYAKHSHEKALDEKARVTETHANKADTSAQELTVSP